MRLELVEFGAVDDAGDHFPRVERDAQVRGHDADQLLGVEQRLGHRARARALASTQFSRATMRRPMRIASSSSTAK